MSDPRPGRLNALSTDLDDSARLLTIIKSLATMSSDVQRSSLNRVLREVIYFTWEKPRLPRPLMQAKYPQKFPWSPDARRQLETAPARPPGGYALVFEHVIPRQLLCSTLLNSAGSLNHEDLLALLADGIAIAIVTKAEDRRLPTGLNLTWTEYVDDPWLRYRHAEFKISEYQPLALSDDKAETWPE